MLRGDRGDCRAGESGRPPPRLLRLSHPGRARDNRRRGSRVHRHRRAGRLSRADQSQQSEIWGHRKGAGDPSALGGREGPRRRRPRGQRCAHGLRATVEPRPAAVDAEAPDARTPRLVAGSREARGPEGGGPGGQASRGRIRRVAGPRAVRSDLAPPLPGGSVEGGKDNRTACEGPRGGPVGLFDYMDPEEIKSTLRHPLAMICSDGWVAPKEERTSPTAPYQPCTYGEFPGVIERYVVNEEVLSLKEAIRKMTGLPAWRLGLADRGLIRPGFWADLVVFDLPRVRDRATNLWPHKYPFENYPHGYPEGIEWVLVNGVVAVADGQPTGALAGRVLRRTEAS